MAWSKDIEYDTGVIVEYWELSAISINFSTITAEITYLGYLNQDAKTNGFDPIINETFHVDISDFVSFGNFSLFVQNKVLTSVSKFSDATVI